MLKRTMVFILGDTSEDVAHVRRKKSFTEISINFVPAVDLKKLPYTDQTADCTLHERTYVE